MEVRPGYKQTEVGVIPEDWSICALDSLTPQNRKYGIVDGPFGSNLKSIHYRKSGIPIISSGYVTDGVYKADEYLFVDEEKFKQEIRSAVKGGDIVMAKIGARCGASAILPADHPVSILSGNALKITVDKSRYSTFYVWQVLKNFYDSGKADLLRTTGAQPAISIANLKRLQISLPPTLAEQEAIAEALSDADALIEALEQLVAKKRQVKQGAMQDLLTGKRRLPGFDHSVAYKQTEIGSIPEDWDCVQLPHLLASTPNSLKIGPFGSALKKDLLEKKGYKVYGQQNVYESNMTLGDRFISANYFNKLKACEIKTGDFLISMMGTIGKCMIVPEIFEPGIMDSHLIRLRLNYTKLNGAFLLQLFQTPIISNQVKQLSVGGIMEGLSSKIIKLLQLPLPQINEQIAIVEILESLDLEISVLEEKLAKAREVKQGMMQELLTGRIRLI